MSLFLRQPIREALDRALAAGKDSEAAVAAVQSELGAPEEFVRDVAAETEQHPEC